MYGQRYLNVEMKVRFIVPISEDFDINEIPEEDLEGVATDYFFNEMGYEDADYLNFEFEVYKEVNKND
nr:MAG TPA: hypothetical protein [Caudoviricetes sp.]